MKEEGFTLIEVIVVMAIISILAGIMVPFVYRVWESADIDTTRERIIELKKAIVGDPKLIQGGVRMHYGYVGDNGQLPPDIQLSTINNYLAAGFDASMFKEIPPNSNIFLPVDKWNNPFSYSIDTIDAAGRRVSAYIRSAGPDGVSGNVDDIDEDTTHNYTPFSVISSSEVTPTNVIQGNAFFNFYNSQTLLAWDPLPNAFYAGILITYSPTLSQSCCVTLGDIASIPPSGTSQVPLHLTSANCSLTYKIPVGKVIFQAGLYSNSGCSTLAAVNSIASPTAVFVGDGLNAISVNFPTINYTN